MCLFYYYKKLSTKILHKIGNKKLDFYIYNVFGILLSMEKILFIEENNFFDFSLWIIINQFW